MKILMKNRANTMIIAIMICVLSGIGFSPKEEAVEEQSEVTTVEESESHDNLPGQQVVSIQMREHEGNGLVWSVLEDNIIIAANKHLLIEDTEGSMLLQDGNAYPFRVIGLSEQYDLGFVEVHGTIDTVQRVCIPATHRQWEEYTTLGEDVVQITCYGDGNMFPQQEGYVWAYQFIPEFNQEMLVTKCYARAGMSGGGVFSKQGILLGMIAGGQLSQEQESRESEYTYSIPAIIIEQEYQIICNP